MSRGPLVAFATEARRRALGDDDRQLAAALEARGARVEPVVWDADEGAPERLRRFDAVVVRSCWDYYDKLAAFERWVAGAEASGVPLWNPPAVLRWNARKTYLAELAARGLAVVPTVFAGPGGADAALAEARARGWRELVVKPVVSAGAADTFRVSLDAGASPTAAERALAAVLARGEAMVQPFVAEVVSTGEWSLLFFAGAYSHAVLKRPAAGDFRVQHEHGGSTRAAAPPAPLVAFAAAAVAAAGAPLLYARVDVVPSGAGYLLGELELIEPFLFAGYDPGAPARFADALFAVLR